MKYSIVTFGCRVNQADSLAIEAELAAAGGQAVSSEHADVVVVNTCSVTASADQGARQTIRRIARTNPGAKIVATGCYATRCADEVAALPGVIAVISNDDKLRSTLGTLGTLGTREESHCGHVLEPGLMGRTAWTLRVQTGCEEQCSYCIIPTTRGASRSRPIDDIQAEVARVVAAGYKEIAITGVHLGSYGRDLSPRSSLSELLAGLAEMGDALGPAEAGPRVLFRVSSLEPMDFPHEILDLATPGFTSAGSAGFTSDAAAESGFSPAARSVIAPHFHLPLQHASNRILELMRRPYSIEYYADLVNALRKRLPHAAIGSDVIAGFPSESDDDFAALVAYLETSPLTHLHVFPYSDRPGTAASSLPDKVHGSIIKARAQRLREVSRRLADDFRAAQRGSVRSALTIDDGTVAVTDNYFRVPASGANKRNEWITVTL
jgi:threonylcarbamoyladenosine tRNA methylthiotransferase MtaB